MTKEVLPSHDPKFRVMTTSTKKQMISFIIAIGGASTIWGQSAVDRLQPLVQTSARRLLLAKQVALAKWDTQAPVEDLNREAQVITAAAQEGESKGLDRAFVSHFFAAQIDANKLVQYSLLAEWHRAGEAPKHHPVSLTADIRPQLDQIEAALIAELVETADIRVNPSCQGDTAKAVGKYLAHRHLGTLLAIALDRAMAANCRGTEAM
jgi:chorismate mutase